MGSKLQLAHNSSIDKEMRIFLLLISFALIMNIYFVNTCSRGCKTNIREVRRCSAHTGGFKARIGEVRMHARLKRRFYDLKKVNRSLNGKCTGCFKWQYPFLIKPKKGLCTTSQDGNIRKIDLLLFITSKHSNIAHRQLLRKVYNSSQVRRHRHKVIFLFGADPEKNRTNEKLLKEESNTYGDVLQMNLNGTYRNLTPIVYNSIQWALDNCLNAKFIGKVTDDTIMNIPGIFQLLDTKGESELQDNVFGACMSSGAQPVRQKGHKWFTDKRVYPFDQYPPFCSGAQFFMSIQTAREIMIEVGNIAFHTGLDDVALGLNIQLTGHCVCNVPGFRHQFKIGYFKNVSRNCPIFYNFYGIHLHGETVQSIEEFWGHHSYFKVNSRRLNSLKCKRRFTCRSRHYPFH